MGPRTSVPSRPRRGLERGPWEGSDASALGLPDAAGPDGAGATAIAINDAVRPVPAPDPPRAPGGATGPTSTGCGRSRCTSCVAFHAGVGQASSAGSSASTCSSCCRATSSPRCCCGGGPTGGMRFGGFYARRVRRLLPAAVVNLIVTARGVRGRRDAGGAPRPSGRRPGRGAVRRRTGSSSPSRPTTSPPTSTPARCSHYWSLSVEEQFYLLWPLLLVGLSWPSRPVRRRDRRVVRAVVAGGWPALSAIAAVVIARTDLNRAYYGTDTRAYQLLAGALWRSRRASSPRLRRSRAGAGLPLASWPGSARSSVLADRSSTWGPSPGALLTTVVVVCCSLTLEAAAGGIGAGGAEPAAARVPGADLLRHLPVALAGDPGPRRTPSTSRRRCSSSSTVAARHRHRLARATTWSELPVRSARGARRVAVAAWSRAAWPPACSSPSSSRAGPSSSRDRPPRRAGLGRPGAGGGRAVTVDWRAARAWTTWTSATASRGRVPSPACQAAGDRHHRSWSPATATPPCSSPPWRRRRPGPAPRSPRPRC